VLVPFLLVANSCHVPLPVESPHPRPDAWRLFEEGERLRRVGKPEDAIDLYRRSVDLDPYFTEAHREIQNLETSACRRAELLRTYRDLVAAHPRSAVFRYLLGRIESDPDRQRKLFEEATELDPTYPWGAYGLAFTYQREGLLERAAAGYRAAIGSDPSFIEAYFRLAECLNGLGRRDEAVSHLVLAVVIAPNRPETHLTLAATLAASDRYPEAVAAALPALNLAPGSAEVHRMIQGLLDRGAPPRTLSEIRETLARREDDVAGQPLAYLTRARVSRGLGEPYRAIEEAREGLAAGGSPLDFSELLRDLLLEIRDYSGALTAWRLLIPDAVVLDPGNVHRDRWERVYELLEGATYEGAVDPDFHLRLAEALARVGWLEQAESEYRVQLHGAPADERAIAGLEALSRHRRFLERVDSRIRSVYGRFARGDGNPSLSEFLEIFHQEGASILGDDLRAGLSIRRYAAIGSLVIPGFEQESALSLEFDRYGEVVVIGRQAGGPAEALIAPVLSVGPGSPPDPSAHALTPFTRVVTRIARTPTFREFGGARLGGIALGTFTVVNFDVVLDWQGEARAAVEGFLEDPEALDEVDLAPYTAVEDASSVGDATCVGRRLLLRAYRERARRLGLEDPFTGDWEMFLGVVDAHEWGHLVDFHRFVPISSHLLGGLAVFLDLGLSRARVEQYLEENAQLAALALGPEPYAALAQLVTDRMAADATPPHSLGYYRLTREWVRYVRMHAERFPRIDPSLSIVQQLDHLDGGEIRRIARALAEERGVRY